MEHEHVAVRIREVGHVADAGVERLAEEGDAACLELAARLLDIATRSAMGAECGPRNSWPMFVGSRR